MTKAQPLRDLLWGTAAFCVVAVVLMRVPSVAAQNPQPQDPAMEAFSKAVDRYLQIHKAAEGTVPKLKETDTPQQIAEREHLLAQSIQQARVGAREGEIFGTAKKALTEIVRADWRRRPQAERAEIMGE